ASLPTGAAQGGIVGEHAAGDEERGQGDEIFHIDGAAQATAAEGTDGCVVAEQTVVHLKRNRGRSSVKANVVNSAATTAMLRAPQGLVAFKRRVRHNRRSDCVKVVLRIDRASIRV